MSLATRVNRIEPFLFWALLAVHLVPVLAFQWFPTVDGPSLLYNARILKDLIGGDLFTAEFFRIDPFPEPYWSGHTIMAATMTFAPAWLAEKVVLVLCVAGMAISFRAFIRTVNPEAGLITVLIFPFLYSFLFRLGFFNFCMSVGVMFLVCREWALQCQGRRPLAFVRLGLLLTLLYFTHPSTFLITLVAIGLWHTRDAILLRTGSFAQRIRSAWPMTIRLSTAALPSIVLLALYFGRHASQALPEKRLPLTDLFWWLVDGRAWITLMYEREVWPARMIMLALVVLLISATAHMVRTGSKGRSNGMHWLWLAGLVLVAFFALPDQMANGSLVSPRLLFFAMLALVVWLCLQHLPTRSVHTAVGLVVIAQFIQLWSHQRYAQDLDRDAQELLTVLPSVRSNSVLLPLNYSDNWLHGNLSAYLGANKNVCVLDNFLACASHSPTQWRNDRLPYTAIGDFQLSHRPCVRLNGYQAAHGIAVDHVLLWGTLPDPPDSCTADVMRQLAADYRLTFTSPTGMGQLYTHR